MSSERNKKIVSTGWHNSNTFPEACSHAWNGIKLAFKTERNIKIQIVIYAFALLLAFFLKLSLIEITLIILISTLVLTLELINTVLEYFSDLIKPQKNKQVKTVKDIAAGAVMIASIAAIIIGLLIYLPPLISLFS